MKANDFLILMQSENRASAWSLSNFFGDIPKDVLQTLEIAHSRYEHLIDITSGCFSCEQIEEDRSNYPELIKKHGNKPFFDDDDCAAFMSKIYGLPKLLCRMYITNDFNWTIKSGFVEGELKELLSKSENLLSESFKDEDIEEVNAFFNCRISA